MPGFVVLTWNPNKSEVETGKSGVQGQSWLMSPILTPIILAKEKNLLPLPTNLTKQIDK